MTHNVSRGLSSLFDGEVLRRLRRVRANVLGVLSPCVMLVFSAGCSADSVLIPPADVGPLYWELRVNYPAVRLSLTDPYDTLRLVATPYDANGAVWTPGATPDVGASPDTGVTVWSSEDSLQVRVSPDGLLTAREEVGKLLVVATRTIGRVTHRDTVWVSVKDEPDPPTLTTFRVRPIDDSLKYAANSLVFLSVVALDEYGDRIDNPPFKHFTSNRDATYWQNFFSYLFLQRKGIDKTVQISAITWIYGVVKRDSFSLRIGWPLNGDGGGITQTVDTRGTVAYYPRADLVDIGPGGSVSWENRSAFGPTSVEGKLPKPGVPMDVIFDDPTAALPVPFDIQDTVGGNIRGIPSDTTLSQSQRTRYRRFLTPGRYGYTIQPVGVRGVVVVHDR